MGHPQKNKLVNSLFVNAAEMKAYLTKKTGSPEVAEDIFHDLVVRFLEFEKSPDIKNFRSYVFSSASNAATDYLRKKSRMQRLEGDFRYLSSLDEKNPNEVESKLLAKQQIEIMGKALDELSPRCRGIFYEVRVKGKTHKRVAANLGISIRTVERNLAQALRHCHQRMKE